MVICAYTMKRWDLLGAAVRSATEQTRPATEVLLVVDHNDELLVRATAAFPGVHVVANGFDVGLSGARNTGIQRASGDVLAFLDDDAAAEPDWLERLAGGYDDPNVFGVGGYVDPAWERGDRPRWMPSEFDWVVGCSYRGLPTTTDEIRNPIGANMSIRREVFGRVGGFESRLGRVGTTPLGCEETELCIRARQHQPGSKVLHQPDAIVHHFVPSARTTLRYYHARCRAEGISKAHVGNLVGASDGMSSERTYLSRTLPTGIVRALAAGLKGDVYGPARAGLIVSGLGAFALGYLPALRRLRRASPAAVAGLSS